jgi:molybdate transport repressor ModE-like protein
LTTKALAGFNQFANRVIAGCESYNAPSKVLIVVNIEAENIVSPSRLKIFHEIAKCGSIRAASEVLGVAPSSVSRQVALLEHEMGTSLLERTSSGVNLTHAGKMVANYARSVVLGYDSLRSDLDDARGRRRKLIRLALVESVLTSGPISAITEFRRRFDTVVFQIEVMPAPKVIECVKRDECDIGITFCPIADPSIVSIMKFPEPIGLVMPKDHALAGRLSVGLADLAELPLALPATGFSVRQILDEVCASTGMVLEPVMVSNAFESLRNFVLCGGGGAVLPWRAGQGNDSRLVNIPIAEPRLRSGWLEVMTQRNRRLPRVTTLFLEMLELGLQSRPVDTSASAP